MWKGCEEEEVSLGLNKFKESCLSWHLNRALQAFIDHGAISRMIDSNVSEAEGIYSALEKLGIDCNYIGTELEPSPPCIY